MKLRLIQNQLGGWAVLILVLSAALAALAPAVSGQDTAEFYGWNGQAVAPDGKVVYAGDEATLQNHLAQLEEVRLRIEAQRDFEGARRMLADLRLAATLTTGFAGQRESMVKTALALSELHELTGDLDGALESVSVLLRRTPRSQEDRMVLVPAPESLINMAKQTLMDERLVERRSAVQRLISASQGNKQLHRELAYPTIEGSKAYVARVFGTASDSVLEAVAGCTWRGLDPGDRRLVGRLDKRASAALARYAIILPVEGGLPPAADPLELLLEIDEFRATELIFEFIETGGTDWRQRAMALVLDMNLIQSDEAWIPSDGTSAPPKSRRPRWLDILARLLQDPVTRKEALRVVNSVAAHDALSGSLQTALSELVTNGNPADARDVMYHLTTPYRIESGRPVFEAATRHADAAVRLDAASKLSRYRECEALLALADDEVAEVRATVARSLDERQVPEPSWSGQPVRANWKWNAVHPIFGPRERALLTKFATDSAPTTRLAATEAIVNLPDALAPEVYIDLAVDPDPRVRATLARFRHPDAGIRAQVLGTLARDDDSTVLAAVDEVLRGVDWEVDTELLPVLGARYFHPGRPLVGVLWPNVCRTEAGLLQTVRWGLDHGQDKLTQTALGVPQCSGLELARLSPADFGRLFVWSHSRGVESFVAKVQFAALASSAANAALRAVVADAEVDRPVRCSAARLIAPSGGAEVERALLALSSDPAWKSHEPLDIELRDLSKTQLPAGSHNLFLLRVLSTPDVHERVARELLSNYDPDGPSGDALTEQILARWHKDGSPYVAAVESALEHLGSQPIDKVDLEQLERAVRNPDYTLVALEAMGRLGAPEFLPTLGECLQGKHMRSEDLQRAQVLAAKALTGYLSVQAAQQLVEGLGAASDTTVKASITEGLARIRSYQEERRRWYGDPFQLSTREAAQRKLLELLWKGSEAQRAEAARGLGTFGAVEAIPLLISMLDDESDVVVAGVRAALDTLHAAGARGN